MSSNYNDAESYCKDCDRSIYGKYHDCDINIENKGMYVKGNSKCYCKITFVQTQSGFRFGDPHCKRCGQAIDWGSGT